MLYPSQCEQVRVTGVPPKVGGQEAIILLYIIYDINIVQTAAEKVISPGSHLVTLCVQPCLSYSKLLELQRKKRKKYNINKGSPPSPGFQWMIPPHEKSSHEYNIVSIAVNDKMQDITFHYNISSMLPCYECLGIVLPFCSPCTYHKCLLLCSRSLDLQFLHIYEMIFIM